MLDNLDSTDKVCMFAGVTATAGGITALIQKFLPALSAIALLIQIVVGGFALYHVFKKNKKEPKCKNCD
jgi:uncharacterized membrane-anchored protein